ncbi:hypothetical protein K413DRAFT_1190 [Clostridium sp. ASBs410]|nr:hypothetical protein K413DRAFT_1190 [Clostridium sp. ASBs410]
MTCINCDRCPDSTKCANFKPRNYWSIASKKCSDYFDKRYPFGTLPGFCLMHTQAKETARAIMKAKKDCCNSVKQIVSSPEDITAFFEIYKSVLNVGVYYLKGEES